MRLRIALISLLVVQSTSFAATIEKDSSTLQPPLVTPPSSCNFYYSDTYYGTVSGTSPPTTPHVAQGGYYYVGTFSPGLSLQFNNFGGSPSPASSTPVLPCSGYYAVAFSLDLRLNETNSCQTGINPFTVSVTSTDNTMPNVYGCPVVYKNASFTYTTPNAYTTFATYCGTYQQWVQCAWTNNNTGNVNSWVGGAQSFWPSYMEISSFPIFSYTPNWNLSQPYYYYPQFSPAYSNMCNPPCELGPSGYTRVAYTPATAYCAQKTYNFKSVVYLHMGATISAPTLWVELVINNYWGSVAYLPMACSMSVVGGKFTVTYLGSNPP